MRKDCKRCGITYYVERSTSDYRFTFCSGFCQANDGVPSIRDLLAAKRNPLLTPEEIDELVARFRQERQELT